MVGKGKVWGGRGVTVCRAERSRWGSGSVLWRAA